MSAVLRRVYHAAPVLVAAYPAAFVAAGNLGEVAGWEVALGLVALGALGAAIHAVAWLALRRRAGASTVAVIAATANAGIFCALLVVARVPLLPVRLAIGSVAVVLALFVAVLVRRGGDRPGMLRAVALAALAVHASLLVSVARVAWRRADLARSAAYRALADAPLPAAMSHDTLRPDIYLLVLDNLASPEVLQSRFGEDERWFTDSLRSLGFVLPTVRSNYAHTAHSMSSMLQMEHLTGLESAFDQQARGLWPLYRIMHRDRATRFLRERGYQSYVLPSLGFPGTAVHDLSTVVWRTRALRGAGAWLQRSWYLDLVWRRTTLGALVARWTPAWRRYDASLAPFDGARELMVKAGPKFVLAHVLSAHAPFLSTATCAPRSDVSADAEDSPEGRLRYRDEVRCMQREVISLVTELRGPERRPSVILLQADHGPRSLGAPLFGDAATITPAQAAERFGAFGAYYFPGGARVLPDTVTPVNLLRFVLAHYFGALLPPRADESYYTTADRPYHFIRVPVGPPGQAVAAEPATPVAARGTEAVERAPATR